MLADGRAVFNMVLLHTLSRSFPYSRSVTRLDVLRPLLIPLHSLFCTDAMPPVGFPILKRFGPTGLSRLLTQYRAILDERDLLYGELRAKVGAYDGVGGIATSMPPVPDMQPLPDRVKEMIGALPERRRRSVIRRRAEDERGMGTVVFVGGE
jgi:hypothetical protein